MTQFDRIFYIFPGQGSQYRGMGEDLAEEFLCAKECFELASDVVGYDMEKLCFKDEQEQLNLTRFTQPALLTHAIACFRVFQSLDVDSKISPSITAGHSLGEYAALVIAGALSFENALKLVKKRAELMSDLGEGSMLATTLDLTAAKILADKFFCGIGGCNLPEQTVIAGSDDDLTLLATELKNIYPRKRAIPLKTEGAFHTYLMVEAARHFREVLEDVSFGSLEVDVLSNYTGELHESDANAIRSRLFFQLFNPVKWMAGMDKAISAGVEAIIEFGGGIGKGLTPEEKRPNLEGMVKKSLKLRQHQAEYYGAISVVTIKALVEEII
ncbi:MAG: malonyl CoA-acyl carrier protein transacylase [Rhodospirillaceae bacterium]|nr:malonyl CoA-acyl carrier protein transacylase [Rhodospirillaceae bacterium]|tara:strand:- start:3876 stop:4856 length:981 start_codon:yes stop_codon:yes gene_type:complete